MLQGLRVVEFNGFDESGIIGENLRFVRVGIREENGLRPFVYNLLHFGSVSASKAYLAGASDRAKAEYVRMVLTDPAFTVTPYVFPTEHQIQVLRKFTLLEQKQLFTLEGT